VPFKLLIQSKACNLFFPLHSGFWLLHLFDSVYFDEFVNSDCYQYKRHTGKTPNDFQIQGYAFCQFVEDMSTDLAIRALHNTKVQGRKVLTVRDRTENVS